MEQTERGDFLIQHNGLFVLKAGVEFIKSHPEITDDGFRQDARVLLKFYYHWLNYALRDKALSEERRHIPVEKRWENPRVTATSMSRFAFGQLLLKPPEQITFTREGADQALETIITRMPDRTIAEQGVANRLMPYGVKIPADHRMIYVVFLEKYASADFPAGLRAKVL